MKIIKKIIKYLLNSFLIFIVSVFIFLLCYLNPKGEYIYLTKDYEVGKNIVFTIPMIKAIDMWEYDMDKYRNYIFSEKYQRSYARATFKEFIDIEENEIFLIKNSFRFKKRGTAFDSGADDRYYVLEDSNRTEFIIQVDDETYDGKLYDNIRKFVD